MVDSIRKIFNISPLIFISHCHLSTVLLFSDFCVSAPLAHYLTEPHRMETLIEQQRRYHEERERIVDTMVKELLHKKMSHRDSINSEHRTKMLLDKYMESTKSLRDLYEDKDSARKAEIQALGGPNEFNEFYNRLKTIKEFYRKHPNEVSLPMSLEFEEYTKMRESTNEEFTNLVEFKDEEGYGKYLDLNECFEKYLNLKGVQRVDYITFLSIFDRMYEIPKERKGAEYRKYAEELLDYLYNFIGRIKPLLDVDGICEQVQNEFEVQWESGQFPGWPKETHTGALAHTGAHLDLSAFSTWEELATLGLDRLKSGLMALGLKCGGTLEERAKRLFSTKGKSFEEIDPAHFSKSKPGTSSTTVVSADKGRKDSEKNKEIALAEAQIFKLAELLAEQRNATKENVTRKQARTAGEKEESEEEVDDHSESEEDDDDIPYNPKNLPLGWDGKPIPYWLYKLHGLNISYNCEICGNFVYKGPKAFQRHFAEWRHAHGMRCLGIPNTAHFANVTQIEDALQLWEKLRGQKTAERWAPDQEEEFEDSMGNVVNKKTFEDLKRQGLL